MRTYFLVLIIFIGCDDLPNRRCITSKMELEPTIISRTQNRGIIIINEKLFTWASRPLQGADICNSNNLRNHKSPIVECRLGDLEPRYIIQKKKNSDTLFVIKNDMKGYIIVDSTCDNSYRPVNR